MQKVTPALILLFLNFCMHTFGQHNQIKFKHLTIDDGLSQNSVSCIHQDKFGFMWFGTHDGLNRYDGYQFFHYRNERNNANSISNNYIYDIHEDNECILWVATFGGGLNSLNPKTGEIKRHQMTTDDAVAIPDTRLFSIAEYPAGILWIGGNEGLIRFDKRTSRANLFLAHKNKDNIYEHNYIGIVIPDQTGDIWLRSDSGLTRFNTTALTYEYYNRSPFSKKYELGEIYDINQFNGMLYITCKAGLVELNPRQKTDTLLLPATALQSGNLIQVFQEILALNGQHFVFGTSQGIAIFDAATKNVSLYQYDAADDESLSHNTVLTLFRSKDGIIWVGTRNGLNKIEAEKPNFLHIRSIPGKAGLSCKNVSSFMEHNDSMMWIGTTDGLNLFNANSNAFNVFRKDERKKNTLASDYVLSLYKDSKGSEWVGTRGEGFYKIEPYKGEFEFKRILPLNETNYSINIHCLLEQDDKYLWVGTGGEGLWNYNRDNNSIKKYFTAKDGKGPSHPWIFAMLQESSQYLWIGTPSGGLNLFDPQTESFLYFQNDPKNEFSLNNNIILSLHQDKQRGLWIGTNDGLSRLIPRLSNNIFDELKIALEQGNDSLFKNFGMGEGFPNNVIYGMLEDNYRNLWISTNKGISVFNMDEERVVKTFDVSDGLQSNEFNQNAYYKSKNNLFYFGGVNGVNIFNPDSVKDNPFIPPVVLTSISIFNEPIEISKKRSVDGFILEEAIHSAEKINLLWKHNVITFEFAALSFISPEKNQFRYILEGFDKGWINAGTRHSATYTHLDPGKYVFRVRASNNSGIWNETGTSLIIYISAPPWLSWYAYVFYSLILIGAGILFLRFRIKKATEEIRIKTQIEQAREQEREEFRKKSAADFHDEVGNKITKITLFTEMARSELNNKTQLERYLDKIQFNISDLSSGMRDFLWVMDPKHDSLFETLSRLKDFGDSILTETGVRFTIHGMNTGLHSIQLSMNTRRELLQIFKEAINNCAKYADATEVTLTTAINENIIDITLSDNGKGFKYTPDMINNKYGLKIMCERAKKIGAELFINSEKNNGTTISLKCNMPHMGNSN